MLHDIPQDPSRKEFQQDSTLGNEYRHWRRAKFLQQYRLFFRIHSRSKVIVLGWVNDQQSKRAYGNKSDAYRVFQAMPLKGVWACLLRSCRFWQGPEGIWIADFETAHRPKRAAQGDGAIAEEAWVDARLHKPELEMYEEHRVADVMADGLLGAKRDSRCFGYASCRIPERSQKIGDRLNQQAICQLRGIHQKSEVAVIARE